MKRRVLVAAFWLAACEGDDGNGGGKEGEAEGEAEAEAEAESESEGEDTPTWAVVLGASMDAASGGFGVISLKTLQVVKFNGETLAGPAMGDAVGRAWFDTYFVVNRFNSDSVQVHDPANEFALVKQFSVGSTTDNAQDICCIAKDRCYVPHLQLAEVWVVDPTADDELVDTIDLSEITKDGNPNANGCLIAGDKLLVALGNLDDEDPFFSPFTPGYVAVIDTKSHKITTEETCAPNPYARFIEEPSGETALISCVGDFGVLDGGFCRIELDSGVCTGVVVTEKTLGGDATRAGFCQDNAFTLATICDEEFNCTTALRRMDLDAGTVGEPLYEIEGFGLTWVASSGNRMFVAERHSDGTNSGVRVFDCEGTQVTDEPIDIGLPPAFEGVIEFL
jgi:hypothetical protein